MEEKDEVIKIGGAKGIKGMTSEIGEETSVSVPRESSRCAKIFEYVKNRNRIGPSKIELADCDFFIVGPRRTLRVLLPVPRGNVYYETRKNERPETVDENFISRWASRPHPSGNCRCSFRRSKNRSSINDEISENREIDNLDKSNFLQVANSRSSRDIAPDKLSGIDRTKDDAAKAVKNKIVKDLEDYIERLLQEVVNDTMKFFNDAGDTLEKSREILHEAGQFSRNLSLDLRNFESGCESIENTETFPSSIEDPTMFTLPIDTLDISFAFHDDETKPRDDKNCQQFDDRSGNGYVNKGFDGSVNDPDSLDFHLEKSSIDNEHEHLDCTDSGINSVETMEFQTLSQEPSLEQSLMEIIEAKFGATTSKESWKNLESLDPIGTEEKKMEDEEKIEETSSLEDKIIFSINDEVEENESNEYVEQPENVEERIIEQLDERNLETLTNDPENRIDPQDIEEEANFDKLRLELSLEKEPWNKKLNAIEALREKFTWKYSTGCKNRKEQEEKERIKKDKSLKKEETTLNDLVESKINNGKIDDSVTGETRENVVELRKVRKPIIVFLHGFGSSAEIFENQLEYFSNLGYPCIAPELLGHGLSSAPDRPKDYRFEELLKDLETVLQHYAFGPGKKCVLVAHNYGCSFATALACKYDSNVHQLVLISGGGPTPLAPPRHEGAGHCCLRAMLTPLLMCGLGRDVLYSPRGRQHPYCGLEPIEQRPSHMKYVLDGMIWPEGDYVFHRRITAPTLLIHGLRDDKVSLVQECQMERTIIKAFLDAIPTAGHTPMIDCPEQINHTIHCFIDLWKRKKR